MKTIKFAMSRFPREQNIKFAINKFPVNKVSSSQ